MKKLAVISITVNIVFCIILIAKRIYYYLPHPPIHPTYADKLNDSRSQTLNALPLDSNDIVFIGDSETKNFPLTEMFMDLHIKNRGIGENTSTHILGRIGPIISAHPKKIFLMMGINDLGEAFPLDSLLLNFDRLASIIRNGSPKTQLYIESIMPVSGDEAKLEPYIEKFNPRLRGFCAKNNIEYIDLFTPMYNGHGLDSSLTRDGLHLNLNGYKIWKNKIEHLL